MITILFATNREARPFLSLVGAELIETKPFGIYRSPVFPHLRIMISRMGKIAAATGCQAAILLHGATRIINPGACGALRDTPDLAVGNLVRISEASEGDHEIFGKRVPSVICGAGLGGELPQARLVTSDKPVFDPLRRAEYAQFGDVVDMEGAAVARAAALYQVPCDLIKGITDTALHLERDMLLRNLDAVCERIGLFLKNALSEWTDA